MKKLVALVLCILLLFSAAFALEAVPMTLIVQGTAAVTAKPDLVSVTANVGLTRENAALAQADIAAIISKLTNALTALGIGEDDVITQSYSFYPAYDYEQAQPTVIGYTGNHTVVITCRDVNLLDALLNALTDCGVSEVYNISYDVNNRSELYRQALCDALQIAADKAALLATSTGCTSVVLDTVQEQAYYDDGIVNTYRANAAAKEDAFATGVRAGTVSVTASVEATFIAE